MSERENLQAPSAPPAAAAAVAPAPDVDQAPQVTPPRGQDLNRRLIRLILLITGGTLLALALIVGIVFYLWHQGYYFYSSDDAVVSGNIAAAAPPVPGTVVNVYHGLGSTVGANNTIALLRTATGSSIAVRSPIAGTIIYEGATPGEVLPAGQPLAQVVNLNALYITAYVEETHINDVQLHQGVDITVDAVQGTTFHGSVSRILPAAADTFSPIPSSDNANGNFTKVTQRVPVIITINGGFQGKSLYPGESAEVTIHLHE